MWVSVFAPKPVGSVAAQAGQGGNKGGDDEYAKFMREMQGLHETFLQCLIVK